MKASSRIVRVESLSKRIYSVTRTLKKSAIKTQKLQGDRNIWLTRRGGEQTVSDELPREGLTRTAEDFNFTIVWSFSVDITRIIR